MNTVDKVLGFSLQEPFLWTNIYTRQKTPGMKSQASSRKKLPIMGSCTNTRNFDTGQIDATNRQLLHSSRPQIDMKTTRRITMRYTIYIETLRVKRLYHLIAHFEIVGADRRPHRNIQIRRNRTIHINHLIDRPSNDMSGHASPPGMNSSTSPMNGIVKQNGDTIGRRHSYRYARTIGHHSIDTV